MSRRSRRHGGHDEEHVSEERWLLTYSDMITLLLALFIVLFAISTIDQKKFLALELGLKETFNPKPSVLTGGTGVMNQSSLAKTAGSQMAATNKLQVITTTTTTSPGPATSSAPTSVSTAALAKLQQQIQEALAKQGLQAAASLQLTTRGLVVQVLADKAFFATGSADLGPTGNRVVDAVASVLRTDTYDIDVEGYTDNQPVTGGVYSSNEELSAVRAVNVVLRLESQDTINPNRLSATGYGDTRPEAPNNSPENMALNRRIDIVILSDQQAQP